MYISDNKVFADASEKLIGGKGKGSVDALVGSLENGIDFNYMRIHHKYCGDILMYNKGCTIILPEERTFTSIYKMFLEEGYSSEAQLEILMSKDKSDIDKEAYEDMLVWMDFADKAAKLACPFLGVNVEETLDSVRNEKLKEIEKFDSSAEVNSFMYNGLSLWLDKSTRVGLMNSTAILQNAGQETTTLWLGSINVTLPCSQVILMLSQIEMYALECYNKTAEHKAKVEAMSEIEDIKAYNHREGYPTKLVFGQPPVEE